MAPCIHQDGGLWASPWCHRSTHKGVSKRLWTMHMILLHFINMERTDFMHSIGTVQEDNHDSLFLLLPISPLSPQKQKEKTMHGIYFPSMRNRNFLIIQVFFKCSLIVWVNWLLFIYFTSLICFQTDIPIHSSCYLLAQKHVCGSIRVNQMIGRENLFKNAGFSLIHQ